MKKAFVTGGSGLVGSRVIELLKNKYNFVAPEYPDFDLTKPGSVANFFKKSSPDVVINFAAFTDVSAAETQRDDKNASCWKINVDGIKNLANLVSPETYFIQISTDMVFPGSEEFNGPYKEDDKPEKDSDKLTWYGYTKAQAERIVSESLKNSAILRLIYPVRAKYALKLDYLRKPLSLYDQGRLYPMFDDQQVSISFVDEIAHVLDKMIDKKVHGIFHASSSDVSTPYELVSYFLKKARGVDRAVKRSSLDDFLKTVDNPVRYPKYGGLKVDDTEKTLGIKFNSWKAIIDKLIEQGISV